MIKAEEAKLGTPTPKTLATCSAQLEASLGVICATSTPQPEGAVVVAVRTASGASMVPRVEAGFPTAAFPTLLLRGSARAVQ